MDMPPLPYDNLYKLMAIGGMILLILGLFSGMYGFVYLREKYSDKILLKIRTDMQMNYTQAKIDRLYDQITENSAPLLNLSSQMEELVIVLSNKSDQIQRSLKYYPALQKEREKAIETIMGTNCYVVEPSDGGSIIRFTGESACIEKVITNESFIDAWEIIRFTDRLSKEINNESLSFNELYAKLVILNKTFVDKKNVIDVINSPYENEVDTLYQQMFDLLLNDYLESYYYTKEYETYLKWLDDIDKYLIFVVIIGSLLTTAGFLLWYHKQQKIIDESLELDLEMKRYHLMELRNESRKKG